MNKQVYSAIASIFIICGLIILGLYDLYINEKSERVRLSNNITAILNDKARQQELTINELKQLYPK